MPEDRLRTQLSERPIAIRVVGPFVDVAVEVIHASPEKVGADGDETILRPLMRVQRPKGNAVNLRRNTAEVSQVDLVDLLPFQVAAQCDQILAPIEVGVEQPAMAIVGSAAREIEIRQI